MTARGSARLSFNIVSILVDPLRPSDDLRLLYVVSAPHAALQRYVLRADSAFALGDAGQAARWVGTRFNRCHFKRRWNRGLLSGNGRAKRNKNADNPQHRMLNR